MRAFCERLRVPNEERELALAACRCKDLIVAADSAAPAEFLQLLKRADAYRRPERFAALLSAAQLAQPGVAAARIEIARAAAARVDAGAVAREAPNPAQIASLLDAAREQAITAALRT
jgi:tRNA nucleotidyltransferase (CCA-adding enzyme)